jgi:hypothetical protein
MLMQIVEVDDDDLAHVGQVGNPTPTTLCGKHSDRYFSSTKCCGLTRRWWESCRAAYRGEAQRHMR